MSDAYTVVKYEGSGATLDNFRFRPTVGFEVRHQDGTRAWGTFHYFSDSLTSRQLGGYRLQAAKQCRNLNAYLERTGKRWEIEQQEKRDAERAAKKKADRIKYLTKAIPEFIAELAELTKEQP